MANGVYGSNKYSVDIYRKSYKTAKKHEFSDSGLINKEKPFPEKFDFKVTTQDAKNWAPKIAEEIKK